MASRERGGGKEQLPFFESEASSGARGQFVPFCGREIRNRQRKTLC